MLPSKPPALRVNSVKLGDVSVNCYCPLLGLRTRWLAQIAGSLSGMIKRLASNLRALGIEVEFGTEGRGRNKRRCITIRKQAESCVPIAPSAAEHDTWGDAGDDTGLFGDDAEAPALLPEVVAGQRRGRSGTVGTQICTTIPEGSRSRYDSS